MRLFRRLTRRPGAVAAHTSATLDVGPAAETPVLVGQKAATVTVVVDGGRSGWDALEWAAAEADVRGRALRIVHVFTWPWSLDPFGNLTVGVADAHARQAAESVLDEAVERARSAAPSLQITTQLQSAAQGAVVHPRTPEDLIVVGRRLRLGRLDRLATASARRLALNSTVPVAVVGLVGENSRGPSTGRVLVGVNDKAGPAAALDFAFRAARRRGIGLTVLHASEARDHAASDVVDNALRVWRDAFPDVNVRQKLVPGPAAQALVEESSGAALVVLGSPNRGRLRRALFGSVARDVLGSTAGPVAIVRPPSVQ